VRIDEAVKVITGECEKIDGLEINFSSDGPEIYWGGGLRLSCGEKDLVHVLKAVRMLSDLGATFA